MPLGSMSLPLPAPIERYRHGSVRDARSRSPHRRVDNYRLYHPRNESSNSKIGSHRGDARHGYHSCTRTSSFCDYNNDYRDRERGYERSRYGIDRGGMDTSGWTGMSGTITMRIRVGEIDLPYVLPISKVYKYDDLERTIDALLRVLLQSGELPMIPGSYAPIPRNWRVTDMSGSIINRIFWDAMCKDGASYVLTRFPRNASTANGISKGVSNSPTQSTSETYSTLTDSKSITQRSLPPPSKIKSEPMDESDNKVSKFSGTVTHESNQLSEILDYVQQTFHPPISNTVDYHLSSTDRDWSIPQSRGIVNSNPTHQFQQQRTSTLAIGRSPPIRGRQQSEKIVNDKKTEPCLEASSMTRRYRPTSNPTHASFPIRRIRIIVRNQDLSFLRVVHASTDMSIADFMVNILNCQPGQRIQHVLRTCDPRYPFQLSLTYMYGTKKPLGQLPAAELRWNWDEKPEIEITLLSVVAMQEKAFWHRVWEDQENAMGATMATEQQANGGVKNDDKKCIDT